MASVLQHWWWWGKRLATIDIPIGERFTTWWWWWYIYRRAFSIMIYQYGNYWLALYVNDGGDTSIGERIASRWDY